MAGPSPRSHLYRLAVLLVVGLVGFLVVRQMATPASWNYRDWYRGDALEEIALQPLIYGGIDSLSPSQRNKSCETCHKKDFEKIKKKKHKTLSCESCHGALFDHVQGEKKIADAKIDRSRWQCENCHAEMINKPEDFPQFTFEVKKHKTLEEGTPCLKCHEAHDPTP